MLPLLVCIAGVVFGLYFNALVLLPISLTGSAIFILVNLASGLSFYANLSDFLFPLISAQAGYLLGATGRDAYGHIMSRFQETQSNRI